MKVLKVCIAFILCTFAKGAEMAGIDYQSINDFDLKLQGVTNSLMNRIEYAESMLESMERKLLQTEKHVVMLEDKLHAYDKSNMLIEQLEEKLTASKEASNEYFIRMKMLEDKLRKSEHDQIVQVEILRKRLENVENRLFYVDELETKFRKAESRLSSVDELDNKLKALDTSLVETKQKSSGEAMEQNSSKSVNENSDNQWYESSIDRKDNERKKGYVKQESGVPTDRPRGLRATIDDRVAIRASGIRNQDGHYPGERILFSSLDYNEGFGFDMSSGTFVCPKRGTYFFTGTIGSVNSVGVAAALKVDGVVKMSLYAGYRLQGDNMCTGVTIFHCRAGQSVWMEVTAGDHLGGWEAISGFLLWSDPE